MRIFARVFLRLGFALALLVSLATGVSAQEGAIFPKIRRLELSQVRDLAMKRSPALAISGARIAAADADAREVSRRVKVNTAGGLDPFSGKIRFYVALDLERLADLSKAERQRARQRRAVRREL